MPAGNGDIGINLWVEENGDLLFFPRCDKKILLITRKNRKT